MNFVQRTKITNIELKKKKKKSTTHANANKHIRHSSQHYRIDATNFYSLLAIQFVEQIQTDATDHHNVVSAWSMNTHYSCDARTLMLLSFETIESI